MFIDFTGAQATLRQEGHVCDPIECISPGRQTWPSWRRAASLPHSINMTLLAEGCILSNRTL